MKAIYICNDCGTMYYLDRLTEQEKKNYVHHRCKRMVDAYHSCDGNMRNHYVIVNGELTLTGDEDI